MAVLSVKAPLSVPVFLISTSPVVVGSPGFMFEAVEDRGAGLVVARCVIVPAVKVLPAFADEAVKFAPEAPVTPTATRTVARAARVRRGLARRILNAGHWDELLGA